MNTGTVTATAASAASASAYLLCITLSQHFAEAFPQKGCLLFFPAKISELLPMSPLLFLALSTSLGGVDARPIQASQLTFVASGVYDGMLSGRFPALKRAALRPIAPPSPFRRASRARWREAGRPFIADGLLMARQGMNKQELDDRSESVQVCLPAACNLTLISVLQKGAP